MNSWFRVETASTPAPAAMAVVAMAVATLCLTPAAEAQVRGNAQAEQGRTLGARSPGRTLPPTGRYVSESGESFIFDRSGDRPLFRFERRAETWVLRPSPAPRGDIIYRNDAGDQILRGTPDGGMTLYTVRAPNGTPAAMTGPAPSLAPPTITPTQLFRFSIQQSGRMSEAVGHLIYINLDLEQPGHEAAVAETISVITEAVLRLARSSTTRDQAAAIRRINVVEGADARISFANGVLTVVTNPAQGNVGRPSSARIIRAVLRN